MSPRLFKPSSLMIGSTLLHLVGGTVFVLSPNRWPVILASMIANHAAIAAAGLHPRSQFMGPNRSRLDGHNATANRIALTFDDGPDPEVTPRVLEILAQHQCRATFFVIGKRAEAHPELLRSIVQDGHGVENHSWDHSHAFFFHTPSQLAAQIDRTQDLVEGLSGQRPRLFRPPAGIRGPLLEPQLARRGLDLVSWNRRAFDTVERRPKMALNRLTKNLGPGDILLLHDGSAARTKAGVPVVLEVLPLLLEIIRTRNLEPVLITEPEPRIQPYLDR